jgi:multisubunit Na+/H+ antiporter MnhB subunit
VNPTAFYLLFIPGVALTVIAGSFVLMAFAMTQGEFEPETRRGLVSLTVVLILAVLLFVLAKALDHPGLPHGG